jgi:hypothetical protein
MNPERRRGDPSIASTARDGGRRRAALERLDPSRRVPNARRSIDRSSATPRRDATRRDANRAPGRKFAHSAVTTIADTRRIESRAPSATRRDGTIAGNRATAKRSPTSNGRARDRSRWNARSRARRDEARRRRRATTGRDDGTRRERRERRERCEGRER